MTTPALMASADVLRGVATTLDRLGIGVRAQVEHANGRPHIIVDDAIDMADDRLRQAGSR